MNSIEALTRALDAAQRTADAIEPSQLGDTTLCAAWSVRDVLNHLVGGALNNAVLFTAGTMPSDQFHRQMETDHVGEEHRPAVADAFDRLRDALATPGLVDRVLTVHGLELPARYALDISVFDYVVHSIDLAHATGQAVAADDAVLAAALERADVMVTPQRIELGMFAAPRPVPDDATFVDRLLARSGRGSF